jgi:hypothetical protein
MASKELKEWLKRNEGWEIGRYDGVPYMRTKGEEVERCTHITLCCGPFKCGNQECWNYCGGPVEPVEHTCC